MEDCCINDPHGLQEAHYQLFLRGAAIASGSTFALNRTIRGNAPFKEKYSVPLADSFLTAAATGQHTILSHQEARDGYSLQGGYNAAATCNYPECLGICVDKASFATYAAEAAMFNCVKYGSGEALYEALKIIHSTDTPAAFDEWTVWDLIQFKRCHPETLRFCLRKNLINPNFCKNFCGMPKNLLQIVLGCDMYGKERKYRLGYAVVLLEEGVHVDSIPTGGRTALWHAVMANDKDAVNFLIRRGADPTFDDNGNCGSPISVAKPPSTLDIYHMLLNAKEDRSVSS